MIGKRIGFYLRRLIFGIFVFFSGEIAAQQEFYRADSLFAIGQYLAAQDLYKSELASEKDLTRPNAILKLAYIAELNGDFTQSLYFLTLLSKITPSEAIYQKMEAIALKERLTGYDFNDWGYLILYLKKYGMGLFLFLLILTGYALFELILKYRKNESIGFVAKSIVILFLLGMIAMLNLGEVYEEGIVANTPTFLRESPSSASAVVGTIGKGNKVIVLGERDHWKLVLLKGKLVYIKKDDLFLI
jgi:tetratricopeptide (TPR) repeat protein